MIAERTGADQESRSRLLAVVRARADAGAAIAFTTRYLGTRHRARLARLLRDDRAAFGAARPGRGSAARRRLAGRGFRGHWRAGGVADPPGLAATPPDMTDILDDVREARIVALAARWVREGRRLDMRGLANELGVSRVTLFRHAGNREELLGKALWMLTERTLETASLRWEAERPPGALHTAGTARHINAIVSQATGLRRLLDDEPALAMRVLTDPRGQVQSGMVAWIARLIRRDIEESGLITVIEPDALAYALVRLGESFLYADVLAARKPDVATANRLQRALLEGVLMGREPTVRSDDSERTVGSRLS
jgi:AcrR family transcriptional regulator